MMESYQLEFSKFEGMYYVEEVMCPVCLGKGFLLTCEDDLCQALGYCCHGDGEDICYRCEGEGTILDGIDRTEGTLPKNAQ